MTTRLYVNGTFRGEYRYPSEVCKMFRWALKDVQNGLDEAGSYQSGVHAVIFSGARKTIEENILYIGHLAKTVENASPIIKECVRKLEAIKKGEDYNEFVQNRRRRRRLSQSPAGE